MVDICTRGRGWHDKAHLLKMNPAIVTEWLCVGVVLHIVLPQGGRIGIDAGTSVVIPVPTGHLLDGTNDLVCLALPICFGNF